MMGQVRVRKKEGRISKKKGEFAPGLFGERKKDIAISNRFHQHEWQKPFSLLLFGSLPVLAPLLSCPPFSFDCLIDVFRL